MSNTKSKRHLKKASQKAKRADLNQRVQQHFQEFQFREAALAAYRSAKPEMRETYTRSAVE